jgi:hypothetical protein
VNRRDALKRLALAGAVATTGPLLVSSPAFADGGTTGSRPVGVPSAPTVGVTTAVAGSFYLLNLAVTGATCPFGSPTTARVQRFYTVASNPLPVTLSPAAGTTYVTGFAPGLTVFAYNFAGIPTGTLVTLQLHVRWVCDNRTGGAAWICRSWEIPLQFDGTTFVVGTITSVTPPAVCDTPPPAAP